MCTYCAYVYTNKIKYKFQTVPYLEITNKAFNSEWFQLMVNENEELLQFASETKPLSIMSSLKTTGLQTKSLVYT